MHVSRARYSVPPDYIGQPIIVVLGEQKVTVRQGQTIIATHRPADRPGACVADPEHLAVLWRRTVPRERPEAALAEQWGPKQIAPEVRPLSVYEEFAR